MPLSTVVPSGSLSFYSIPIIWFVGWYPSVLRVQTIKKHGEYNNVQPRSNVAKFAEKKNISPQLAARVQRMEGAHLNGNEAFSLWTAAVFAGNIAGLDNKLMNTVSLCYILSRFLFNYIYINQETKKASNLRTTVFTIGLIMPITLLIKAANKVSSSLR